MELDEGRLPLGVDEAKSMDTKAIHKAEGAWDGPVGHDPHHHVDAFWGQGNEIPEVVMCRLRLRESPIWFLLHGMDQVWKLDGVLNEKHRNIVPDDVPVSFLRIELNRKAADIARQVRRALVAGHGREAYEDRGFLPGALKEISLRDIGQRRIILEIPTRPEAAGMYHPLGDALMVEVEELLAEVKVFERRGAACTDPERILVVGDGDPLLSGQDGRVPPCTLVYFSTNTGHHTLISVLRRIALAGSVLGRTPGCVFLCYALCFPHTSTC